MGRVTEAREEAEALELVAEVERAPPMMTVTEEQAEVAPVVLEEPIPDPAAQERVRQAVEVKQDGPG